LGEKNNIPLSIFVKNGEGIMRSTPLARGGVVLDNKLKMPHPARKYMLEESCVFSGWK
jgi:hypothetical protein